MGRTLSYTSQIPMTPWTKGKKSELPWANLLFEGHSVWQNLTSIEAMSSTSLCWLGTMFVFGTFGTCVAPDCSEHFAQIHQNLTKIRENQPESPKVNMLKFGDGSFDLGFER